MLKYNGLTYYANENGALFLRNLSYRARVIKLCDAA
jgi:hypothetical protein